MRSYGLLSPGRRADLDRARHILVTHRAVAAPASTTAPTSPPAAPLHAEFAALAIAMIAGALALRCPRCTHGQYRIESHLQRHTRAARPPPS